MSVAAALLGSAAIGGATNLIGGVLGNKAQKKANAVNLQIARETNAQNLQIARENNDLSYNMFLRQLEYASPSEQRRMLEEAGYNPAVFAQGTSSPAVSAPSLQQPVMQSAHVEPATQLAQNISAFGQGLGSFYRDLSEGKLLDAQRQGVQIDNETKHLKNIAELNNLGLVNEALKLDWSWKVQTQQDRVLSVHLDNMMKDAEMKFTIARTAHEEIDNVTRSNLNKKQLEQIDKAIDLLVKQGDTEVWKQEVHKQEINELAARIARYAVQNAIDRYRAETERMVGSSVASSNYADADLKRAQKNLTDITASNEKEWRGLLNGAQYNQLTHTSLLLSSQTSLNNAQVRQVNSTISMLENQAELLRKQGKYYEVDLLNRTINAMSSAYRNIIGTNMQALPYLPTGK